MTTHDPRQWSDAEVELFHDEESPEADAALLAADLRRDTALRDRLADLRRLDRLVARACEAPASTTARPPRRAWLTVGLGLAAAGIALVAGLWLWLGGALHHQPSPTPVPEPRHATFPPQHPSAAPATRPDMRAIRTLARIPLKSDAPLLADSPSAAPEKPPADAFAQALRRGDVLGASFLLADAPPERRAEYVRRLGDALRSSETAAAVLDRLDASEQLELCEAWVREPHLKPVAFARLAKLQHDEALNPRVSALADSLASEPGLASWVRSYGLTVSTATDGRGPRPPG